MRPARSTTGASGPSSAGAVTGRWVRAVSMPIVVSAENGTLPGDRLDQDERQGVEVGAGVELHAHRLLGRCVPGGAEHRARRLGPARLGERARQAEVGDAHDAVLVEQQVRGLDVAVQDPARVRVLERGRRRRARPARLAER